MATNFLSKCRQAENYALTHGAAMAVVHCGCNQYTVKNQTIAAGHYPHATRRVYFPDATHADNAGFSLDA